VVESRCLIAITIISIRVRVRALSYSEYNNDYHHYYNRGVTLPLSYKEYKLCLEGGGRGRGAYHCNVMCATQRVLAKLDVLGALHSREGIEVLHEVTFRSGVKLRTVCFEFSVVRTFQAAAVFCMDRRLNDVRKSQRRGVLDNPAYGGGGGLYNMLLLLRLLRGVGGGRGAVA
jgi:hypothetical protein